MKTPLSALTQQAIAKRIAFLFYLILPQDWGDDTCDLSHLLIIKPDKKREKPFNEVKPQSLLELLGNLTHIANADRYIWFFFFRMGIQNKHQLDSIDRIARRLHDLKRVSKQYLQYILAGNKHLFRSKSGIGNRQTCRLEIIIKLVKDITWEKSIKLRDQYEQQQ